MGKTSRRGTTITFLPDTEIFTETELLFYRKKKRPLDLITQCETLNFFLPIRKDIERLTYANYFIELVDIVCGENDPNDRVYRILVEGLGLLTTEASAKRVARIFEIKFLEALGLNPNFEECVECGATSFGEIFFSVSGGGVLCGNCRKTDRAAFTISLGTVNFIRKILKSPVGKTLQIKVSREVGREIEALLRRFLDFYLNKQTRSLRFLRYLEKTGAIK